MSGSDCKAPVAMYYRSVDADEDAHAIQIVNILGKDRAIIPDLRRPEHIAAPGDVGQGPDRCLPDRRPTPAVVLRSRRRWRRNGSPASSLGRYDVSAASAAAGQSI
jgi:hypothetical protein